MKSLAFVCRCALTLILLCVMGPQPVHALLVIHTLVNKDMNDPQTGRIVLREIPPHCGPYDLILTGITTGFQSIKSNQNPAPGQLISFDQLPADRYEIKIRDQSGCPYVLTAEITSCDGFAIDLDIPVACNGQAWVTAIVTPRPYPLTFEWFDLKNQRVCTSTKSYNADQCRLTPGNLKIKITDAAGCMTMQEFTLTSFDWKVERYRTYACQSQDLVTVLVKNKNNTGFINRLFQYQWSDGQTYTDKGTIERLLPYAADYHLTITDLLTDCQQVIYLPKSERPQAQSYDIHRITYLRHDLDGNNKGAIDIILRRDLKPDLQVRLFKNNQLIQSFTKKDYILSLKDLAPADYRIDVYDGGIHACAAGSLSWQILACDGPKNQVSIEVENKKLPMDQDGFMVQFKVQNSGGPCLYKYSMSTGGANSVFVNKSVPLINKLDIQPLLPTNYSKLKVEAFCPCGNASTELDVFPCNRNFRLRTITEKIENPCYGDLFGTYTVLREKGRMEIKISLPANFASGPDGLPAFGHYLKDLYWGDQSPIQYQIEPGNILSILREVDGPGNYPLYFVDGIGCLYYHLFALKQDFNAKKIGECTYVGSCGMNSNSPDSIIKNARLQITDPTNCQAVIFCDNINSSRTIQGTRYLGPIAGNAPGGGCTFFRYCHFNFEDQLIDQGISYPQGVDLINQIYLPGRQTVQGFITRTTVETDCCRENYLNENELLAYVHPMHGADSRFATDQIPDDWPCYAIMDCGEGWQLITGNQNGSVYCTESGQCYKVTICNYQGVGKVNGQFVNLNGTDYSKLNVRKPASPQDCNESSPDCDDIFALVNHENSIRTQPKDHLIISLYPNPANQTVHVQINHGKDQTPVQISIWNLMGKEILSLPPDIQSGYLFTVDLDLTQFTDGVYLLRIVQLSEQKMVKLVVQH